MENPIDAPMTNPHPPPTDAPANPHPRILAIPFPSPDTLLSDDKSFTALSPSAYEIPAIDKLNVSLELIEDDKVELMLAPALAPNDFNADIPFAPSNKAQAPGLFSNSTNPSKAPLRISPQSISASAL